MKTILIIFFLCLVLFSVKIASAQPGTLDPAFGVGGEVNLHPYFAADQARDIALTTDGKILLLSSDYYIGNYLIKLNSDGTLDSTFGNNGKLPVPVSIYVTSKAIEVDSMNRIVLLGSDDTYFYSFIGVYRFLENGLPDTTFGFDGVATTGLYKVNRALIIQADGKIAVAGENSNLVATVERFNADGTPDTSFNITGSSSLINLPNSYVFALHQQPDGKLLATGTADGNMFVARFNTNGSLDPTFNNIGYSTFTGDGLRAGQDVQTFADGKIFIAGHVETETQSSMLCWKLLPDGSPDNSFGTSGIDTLYTGSENNFAWFAFAGSDSTAIVGGEIFNGLVYQPVLYHVLNDGYLDNSFGINGTAGKTFDCGKSIQVNAVRTTDEKILLCGTGFENGNNLVSVSGFLSDGLVDTSFANNGTVSFSTVDSIYSADQFQDFIPLMMEGKILCAGTIATQLLYFRLDPTGTLDSSYGVNGYYVPNQSLETGTAILATNATNTFVAQNTVRMILGDEDLVDFEGPVGVLLHKLDLEGNPDTSFSEGGFLRLNFPDQGEDPISCTDFKLQSDGKLLFAGYRSHDLGFPYGTYTYVFLERLNADGSIDSTFAANGLQNFDWLSGKASPLLINVRDDDKIDCLYGEFIYPNGYTKISRLLSNGLLDTTFNFIGIETLSLDGNALQLLLQSDNKMLALLYFNYGPYTHGMLRFNEDGIIDSAFANNGYLDLSFLNYGVIGCQLQPDDKILACNGTSNLDVEVVRYLNDGSPDLPFGINGIAAFTGPMIAGANQHLVRLQTDGKILMATENYTDFYIVRLKSDAALPVNEIATSATLKVYPNPASNQLIITDPSFLNDDAVISIATISGKVIKQATVKFSDSSLILSVEDLPSGIYLITVRT
ncbi:MAG: T9SS type A sorting domain-containing protein, partial [Chitinophagales bacterium]